ncbi:hypothetical protein FCM35_KLT17801 [Carex littledalei]|uniref:Uncharacterized protein n=1 Tax=Carex littledalei TaxID=544730 RepID=A0A833VY60_9POAL|nr:hypothetical protein FCM35_KLT17801 [Carex littledalei]
MQPDSSQKPNPNPNHQHDQYHRHFHHHCTHHPPFPHVHIPVFFCPHHDHDHHHLHLHLPHLHFHATQLPCNFPLPSSSSSLSPLPHLQAFSNQTSQGPEISHATVSDLEFPPQELAASNILEDNEEEEEDVYVLTDEWAEFFAKSEAKRQLADEHEATSLSNLVFALLILPKRQVLMVFAVLILPPTGPVRDLRPDDITLDSDLSLIGAEGPSFQMKQRKVEPNQMDNQGLDLASSGDRPRVRYHHSQSMDSSSSSSIKAEMLVSKGQSPVEAASS